MPNLGATEVVLIILVLLLLFGAKKLPDTARGLGRSLRIFKAETKGLRDDDTPPATGSAAAPATGSAAAPATARELEGRTPEVQRTPASERRTDEV